MANLYSRGNNLRCIAWRTSHRSHFEIMASMIEAAKDDASCYSVMKHTSTNPHAIKKYLKSTTEMGLIKTIVKEGKVFYKTTEKGLNFLRQYYVLLGILLNPHECTSLIIAEARKGERIPRTLMKGTSFGIR